MPQTAQSGSTPHRAGAHTASLSERVKPSHASHRPRSRARHCPLVTEVTGEAPHHALPGVRAMGCGATHTEIFFCAIVEQPGWQNGGAPLTRDATHCMMTYPSFFRMSQQRERGKEGRMQGKQAKIVSPAQEKALLGSVATT